MLQCVIVLGALFLTDEFGHRIVNASHVTDFRTESCLSFGWGKCLVGIDTGRNQIGSWRLPDAWREMKPAEVLDECEALAAAGRPVPGSVIDFVE